MTDWMSQAACKGEDPARFFPERGSDSLAIRAVCDGCEVRGDCLEFALTHGERHGIWGGTSEKQRRKIRRESDLPRMVRSPFRMDLSPSPAATRKRASRAKEAPRRADDFEVILDILDALAEEFG